MNGIPITKVLGFVIGLVLLFAIPLIGVWWQKNEGRWPRWSSANAWLQKIRVVPGWQLNLPVAIFLAVFGALIGGGIVAYRHKPGPKLIVDTGFWPNFFVWGMIFFLIGLSLGGFVNVDRKRDRTWQFNLSGLMFVVIFVSLLLGLTVYVAKHANF